MSCSWYIRDRNMHTFLHSTSTQPNISYIFMSYRNNNQSSSLISNLYIFICPENSLKCILSIVIDCKYRSRFHMATCTAHISICLKSNHYNTRYIVLHYKINSPHYTIYHTTCNYFQLL
jgi:hypothetical protein